MKNATMKRKVVLFGRLIFSRNVDNRIGIVVISTLFFNFF